MERMPTGAELKPWGWTLSLGSDRERLNGGIELRAIDRRALACIRSGGYSSIHRHDFQSNAFYCLDGHLVVQTYVLELGRPMLDQTYHLFAGDSLIIPAVKLHKFLALTDVRLLEVYVASVGREARAEDIVRFSDNGCDESLVLQHV